MDERLKKFVQLVDSGSYTQASRQLHISQPALSVAIGKLERELHASLLVHGVRPLTLTPAGRLVYNAGKELLVRANNLRVVLAELEHRELAISVGMNDSVAGAFFGSAESVEELERQASVSLVVDNSRNLLRSVETGTLDLAFVVGQRNYDAALEVIRRATEPLVVVCHAGQRTESAQAVRAGRLPRFISYDRASNSHRWITESLSLRGIVPEATFYSTSPEVMLRLVLLQKGVAVLPWLLVRDYVAAGELVLVGHPLPLFIGRPIHAVKRRDSVLAGPLLRTTQHVATLLASLYADASRRSGA
ncbi:MAG TPA: LysR family transcriptional regulator [Candidatus Saccharimonadales bacterium]|nr:LysR family transcriptional regulator [Candidatus Saccharimonadales bacterium]